MSGSQETGDFFILSPHFTASPWVSEEGWEPLWSTGAASPSASQRWPWGDLLLAQL